MTDALGRAQLRKKFRGIDAQIGRAVGEMADYYVEQEPYRVFSSVEPVNFDGLSIASAWVVWLHITGPKVRQMAGASELRLPLIPDEFNTRPGKVIKLDDKPYQFRSMVEAERHAELGAMNLRKQLREDWK